MTTRVKLDYVFERNNGGGLFTWWEGKRANLSLLGEDDKRIKGGKALY